MLLLAALPARALGSVSDVCCKKEVGFSSVKVTSAREKGGRSLLPLKIISSISAPRSWRAELSPMTHRKASTMFDLPQPFGPTSALMPALKTISVGSAKDLNPDNFKETGYTSDKSPVLQVSDRIQSLFDGASNAFFRQRSRQLFTRNDQSRRRRNFVAFLSRNLLF